MKAEMMLLTPGPVMVPEFVMQAIARPVIHHRTPEFYALYGRIRDQLQHLFLAPAAAVTCMAGSGTAGVEAVMYSLFPTGTEVLIIDIGKFSGRWVSYAKLLGLNTQVIQKDWGETVSVAEIMEQVRAHPQLKGVILTHCETSTGVGIDVEEIAFACKQYREDLLLVVDAITSVGVIPFYFDAWQIDAAVVASQKALMCPAGVVAAAFSPRAQEALRPTDPSDYQNLYYYLQAAQENAFPYTAPVQLLYGIEAALNYLITQEGLPAVWNRVHECAQIFTEGVTQLSGKLFPQQRCDSLTAFSLPGQDIPSLLSQLKEKHHIQLSGGQGTLKGKIARVSHMGWVQPAQMHALIHALEHLISSA